MDDHIHSHLSQNKWDKVYLCFTEQRPIFGQNIEDSFFEKTERKTLKIIHKYSEQVNKFVVFSTVGLWSEHNGAYDIDTPYSFDKSSYLLSKYEITKDTCDNNKVITVFPCNFNSKQRKPGYLFHKLILAITQDQKCEVGNLNFLREMSHATYIAEKLVKATETQIISPGLRINVRQYFTDVLAHFGKKYEDYFNEIIPVSPKEQSYLNNFFVNPDLNYSYEKLLYQTIEDFKNEN